MNKSRKEKKKVGKDQDLLRRKNKKKVQREDYLLD